MLNINKWIYFTMRIQCQINIHHYQLRELIEEEREEQLEQQQQLLLQEQAATGNIGASLENEQEKLQMETPASFMAISDIHLLEITKLRERKYWMHGIMSVLAVTVLAWYLYYYILACKNAEYYIELE